MSMEEDNVFFRKYLINVLVNLSSVQKLILNSSLFLNVQYQSCMFCFGFDAYIGLISITRIRAFRIANFCTQKIMRATYHGGL